MQNQPETSLTPEADPLETPPDPQPTGWSFPWRPLHVYVIVTLYAAAVYLPFLGSSRVLTTHEVIVTQPALEMLEDGHWLVPRFAGQIWVRKPPLVSWMTAACFAAFGGFDEFAARLPAALSAIGLCLLMAILANRFINAHAALWAGLMQATSVYMYMQGRLGEIDLPFAFLIAAAHGVLVWYWGKGKKDLPLGAAAGFHALAGLALLAKGPLAVALLGAGILAFCLVQRSTKPLVAVLWTPAVFAFVLVGLSWYGIVWAREGDVALQSWYYTNVARATGEHAQGVQSPLVYLETVPWLTLPWSVAIVIRIRRLYRDAKRPEHAYQRYLWMWFLGGMVVLLFSAMKHKHYAIPMLPPLSILASKLFAEDIPRFKPAVRRAAAVGFVVALILFGIVGGIIMPGRDHRVPTVEFVRERTAELPPDESLYFVGLQQSFVFPYIRHEWEAFFYTRRGEEAVFEVEPLRKAIAQSGSTPVWILIQHKHLTLAARHGIVIDKKNAEPVRRKYARDETFLLGTARLQSDPATRPATVPVDSVEP